VRNSSAKRGRTELITLRDRSATYGRRAELTYQTRKESASKVENLCIFRCFYFEAGMSTVRRCEPTADYFSHVCGFFISPKHVKQNIASGGSSAQLTVHGS
jgi:hypothetical protein